MNNHFWVAGALIAAVVSIGVLLVWNAVKSIKYKDNKEWNIVRFKAGAISAIVLGALILGWDAYTFFIDPNTLFTLSNVKTFMEIVLGIQAIVALIAGIYYEQKMLRNFTETCTR